MQPLQNVLQAEQMDGRMGEHDYGQERRENAEQKAERLVREGLRKRGGQSKICCCGAKRMR